MYIRIVNRNSHIDRFLEYLIFDFCMLKNIYFEYASKVLSWGQSFKSGINIINLELYWRKIKVSTFIRLQLWRIWAIWYNYRRCHIIIKPWWVKVCLSQNLGGLRPSQDDFVWVLPMFTCLWLCKQRWSFLLSCPILLPIKPHCRIELRCWRTRSTIISLFLKYIMYLISLIHFSQV